MNDQAGDRTSTDWLLDLCVYAPIGLVLDAQKYLPELAEKGRGQVALAKLIGKVAVDRVEKELGPFAAFIRAAAAWDPSSNCCPRCGPDAADPTADPPSDLTDPAPEASPATAERVAGEPPADAEQVPDEAQLPIDGYGTLSASQIVPRLTTLAPAELEAVGRFERANRNRRTVLNRIDQLLGER